MDDSSDSNPVARGAIDEKIPPVRKHADVLA
jgi:hypothetical protein